VAVGGGLVFSKLVTLSVTPVFDTYFDEMQIRFAHYPQWSRLRPIPEAQRFPKAA